MVPESADNKQKESEHSPEFLTRFLVTVAVKIINALQIPAPEIILLEKQAHGRITRGVASARFAGGDSTGTWLINVVIDVFVARR